MHLLKKIILLLAIICTLLFAFSVNVQANEINEEEIIEQAIDNYESLGMSEADAIAQVAADIEAQYQEQLQAQQEALKDIQTNRWGITLTDKEKETIARMLYREAGNQCYRGQAAVVAVFLNRMADGRFGGNTVDGVMYCPGQFTTASILGTVSTAHWQGVLPVVEAVLNGDPVTDNMDYLYFRSDRPRGSSDVKIQGHWFSK